LIESLFFIYLLSCVLLDRDVKGIVVFISRTVTSYVLCAYTVYVCDDRAYRNNKKMALIEMESLTSAIEALSVCILLTGPQSVKLEK